MLPARAADVGISRLAGLRVRCEPM